MAADDRPPPRVGSLGKARDARRLGSWDPEGRDYVLELARRVDDHEESLEHLARAADGVEARVGELVDVLTETAHRTESAIGEVKINQRWILILGAAIVGAVGWVANEVYRGNHRHTAAAAPASAVMTDEARLEAIVDVVELVGVERGDRLVDGRPSVSALLELVPHLRVVRADERDRACIRAEMRRPGACTPAGASN